MDERGRHAIRAISAQFRIQLPEDSRVVEFSREFRSASFDLLSGHLLWDRAVELGETITDRPDAAVEAMVEHPSLLILSDTSS